MRKNSKILILGFILSFPLMALFQNCGKPYQASSTDLATNAAVVDTNDLPIGRVSIDQTSSAATLITSSSASSDDSDARISLDNTLVDPRAESLQDIEDAKADCASLESSSSQLQASNLTDVSSSGVLSADKKSIAGLSGRNVLSSADFGGNSEIDSISDSFGILVLCGINVKNISNSGGKLILIQNSKVESVTSFYGEIFVIEAARALIGNSKVDIHKQ